ncbi:MAG TPA: ankyrin repeat domain-containing protein [Elusimicrobiales bacterium]|nr:ankyrin repeat domain-containing protein [Elusimicrobiales bacterium]
MKKNFVLAAGVLLVCGCAAPALYNSAGKGDLAAVRALLAAGADPNEHTNLYANETPLHMAVWNSRIEVARLLIEHGADVNFEAVASSVGHKKVFGTPLHYAACRGNVEMVQLLLESGANPDPGPGLCAGATGFDDIDMGTPLQLADKRGNKMAAELIKSAISAKLGLTAGGAKNADEYGPIVGALLKGYQGAGKTIAVAGFSYADGRASSDGDVVAARVTTELIKLKKLKVVERKEIQKMLAELKLQNTGAIGPDSAKKLGRLLGADLLVVGTMAELPGRVLELNVRLADVESGEAIGAVSGQVRMNWLN